jgi:uncharacterized protein YqcC (DUF446 family)
MPQPSLYISAAAKTEEIILELKNLGRWDAEPLPEEKFENMGPFGSNTMSFEQWLQFILVPRIQEIVNEHGDFPEGSMLAAYAIRVFDGDPLSGHLHELLYELDELINQASPPAVDEPVTEPPVESAQDTVMIGDTHIPSVLITLTGLLPKFDGEDLENQLQTYDTFLAILSPTVRPALHDLLMNGAQNHQNATSRERLEQAAVSILRGLRIAKPYNHEDAMAKHREEHRKNFPDS